jgi:hypothetical protein
MSLLLHLKMSEIGLTYNSTNLKNSGIIKYEQSFVRK